MQENFHWHCILELFVIVMLNYGTHSLKTFDSAILLPLFKTKLTLTSTRHPRVRHTRNIKLRLVYPLWRLKVEFKTSLKGMMTIPFLLRKVWLMKEYLASRQA